MRKRTMTFQFEIGIQIKLIKINLRNLIEKSWWWRKKIMQKKYLTTNIGFLDEESKNFFPYRKNTVNIGFDEYKDGQI